MPDACCCIPHARYCRVGEVPGIEWEKDFQTWEGLGGWIVVNLVAFVVCIPAATTSCCEEGRGGRKEGRAEEQDERINTGKSAA